MLSFPFNSICCQQTDASIALEVKSMRRWEFNGLDQALSCISSWFSGSPSETRTLKSNLVLLLDKVPSHSSRGFTVASKDLLLNEVSQAELFCEDVFFDVRDLPFDTNDIAYMDHNVEKPVLIHGDEEPNHVNNDIESMGYKDTLLLFRFNNRDLPFKLRQIITSDMKLLTLLESGLPSWVIFFQSYPLFCKLYRPWMRPLFRTLYILISLVTVIIGFYDLYKNVPLLKAAASHICGPLFEWIEDWDMISRLRYLGTMLFLQNFEKAVKWFLATTRVLKMLVSLVTQPFLYPLQEMMDILTPLLSMPSELGELFYTNVWIVVKFFHSVAVNMIDILFTPLEFLYSYLFSLGTNTTLNSWFLVYFSWPKSMFLVYIYICLCSLKTDLNYLLRDPQWLWPFHSLVPCGNYSCFLHELVFCWRITGLIYSLKYMKF